MEEFELINLYNKTPKNKVDNFNKRLNSNLSIAIDYDKVECDFEWLDRMEETIIYLDNILRNPNRFIVNEEEIVKIELARRITVESIKHLSRNTNFIQDYDQKTGDVRPSKILNINKDESYNTYENRFIYTLINNMRSYINLKKSHLQTSSSLKDFKNFDYQAQTVVGQEKVNININVDSKVMQKKDDGNKDGKTILQRIEHLELQISDLTSSEVYKVLAKLHVGAVMSPIKKTNVILKNVNFQYALNLWNYMQEHIQDENSRTKSSKKYEDNGELKKYMDESSLFSYLALNSLNNDELDESLTNNEVEEITDKLIDKIVALNGELSEEKLEEMIGNKIIVARQKNMANLNEIKNIFARHIDKCLEKLKNHKF